MATSQDKENIYRLPDAVPSIIKGDLIVRAFIPWALYSLKSEVSESRLRQLATTWEDDYVLEMENSDNVHLIRSAPPSSLYQSSLQSALDAHIQYGHDNRDNMRYFPWGFLVVHDTDWEAQGLWLVYVDVYGDNPLTAFRVLTTNVAEACESLRKEEDSASQVAEWYAVEEECV